jgi:hypothetical protein
MMVDTIRIFVGCSPDGLDAEAETALEFSIRSRASLPVEITWMAPSRDQASPFYVTNDELATWVTPFSKLRYRIPRVCGYAGRAIYADYDTLCLADIAELWNMPMAGEGYRARDETHDCVMVIDCEEAPRVGHSMRRFLMSENWNCLDGERLLVGDPAMKMLHFTTIDSQPHLPRAITRLASEHRAHWFSGPTRKHWRPELTKLWETEYARALTAGYDRTQVPRPLFGSFKTRAMANYRGHRPAGERYAESV